MRKDDDRFNNSLTKINDVWIHSKQLKMRLVINLERMPVVTDTKKPQEDSVDYAIISNWKSYKGNTEKLALARE